MALQEVVLCYWFYYFSKKNI